MFANKGRAQSIEGERGVLTRGGDSGRQLDVREEVRAIGDVFRSEFEARGEEAPFRILEGRAVGDFQASIARQEVQPKTRCWHAPPKLVGSALRKARDVVIFQDGDIPERLAGEVGVP